MLEFIIIIFISIIPITIVILDSLEEKRHINKDTIIALICLIIVTIASIISDLNLSLFMLNAGFMLGILNRD